MYCYNILEVLKCRVSRNRCLPCPGSVLHIHGRRFEIISADERVLNYVRERQIPLPTHTALSLRQYFKVTTMISQSTWKSKFHSTHKKLSQNLFLVCQIKVSKSKSQNWHGHDWVKFTFMNWELCNHIFLEYGWISKDCCIFMHFTNLFKVLLRAYQGFVELHTVCFIRDTVKFGLWLSLSILYI